MDDTQNPLSDTLDADLATDLVANTSADSILPEALAISEPLVAWLIRSGIGYTEFTAALKPLFLAKAQENLIAQGEKITDSAVSLRSGLHRKDVRAYRETAINATENVKAQGAAWGKPNTASQVVTRWLGDPQYPDRLPFAGEGTTFESLARTVSKDVHPRTVLQEIVRLGIATEDEGQVELLRHAFVPDAKHQEARQLLAGSVADHLQAGVNNLGKNPKRKFLEQSVFANGLSEASMQKLNLLANELWDHVLERLVQAATPLCEQDAQTEAPHRFRLGLFTYGESETTPAPAAKRNSAS